MTGNPVTVLYDACVLYPVSLRSLLMHLAMTGLYRARWSNAIHEEWTGSLLRDRPDISPAQVRRIRELMDEKVEDALVVGYEPLLATLNLPDPDDRHVLAAAIHCQASVIVTRNLRDFPADYLRAFGVEARHPDDFLARQMDQAPHHFCATVRRHRTSLRKPAKTVVEYLETLEAQGLPQAVAMLRQFAALI